ncbi:uncharacterized protein B0H64DRAFT_382934 [Chaetomium fimeti]|uniref:Uncharacterized protein n=1 Tax=Chaetomium fimeti TaxID=1854472 RepID=A0AAE0LXI5_9PEZI|nr:hypothetical protein B0H64DRAFT_382934 [Chaetomium fimeti]
MYVRTRMLTYIFGVALHGTLASSGLYVQCPLSSCPIYDIDAETNGINFVWGVGGHRVLGHDSGFMNSDGE